MPKSISDRPSRSEFVLPDPSKEDLRRSVEEFMALSALECAPMIFPSDIPILPRRLPDTWGDIHLDSLHDPDAGDELEGVEEKDREAAEVYLKELCTPLWSDE
jgi:hypothetical protein